jgi:HSP20 family molecular chaperone IbpA
MLYLVDSYFYYPLYSGDKLNMKKSLSENKVKYEIDLPGVKKEDIKLEAHQSYIHITAKKHRDNTEYSTKIHLQEKLDTEKATAKLEDGVLCIEFPLKEYRRLIKIE